MADKNIQDPETGRIIAGGPQHTNKFGTAGAPTKYDPAYAQMLIDFFTTEATKIVKEVVFLKNGDRKERGIEVPVDFPTLIDFAESIGVEVGTIANWAKAKYPPDFDDKTLAGKHKHPEFLRAYNRAKKLQENIWFKNSLRGFYNPQFAMFVGINIFNYKNKNETDLTTKGKSLNVSVVSYLEPKKNSE